MNCRTSLIRCVCAYEYNRSDWVKIMRFKRQFIGFNPCYLRCFDRFSLLYLLHFGHYFDDGLADDCSGFAGKYT